MDRAAVGSVATINAIEKIQGVATARRPTMCLASADDDRRFSMYARKKHRSRTVAALIETAFADLIGLTVAVRFGWILVPRLGTMAAAPIEWTVATPIGFVRSETGGAAREADRDDSLPAQRPMVLGALNRCTSTALPLAFMGRAPFTFTLADRSVQYNTIRRGDARKNR